MQFVSCHLVLNTAWVALLAAVLFTAFKSLISKVEMITCGETTCLVDREDTVIVDLRQRDDFHKGHIIGSTNLLPSEIKVNNSDELGKHRNKPVIVVNGSGMQCQDSATALIKTGFGQASVLKDDAADRSGENLSLACGK